jgi:cellulose synthase/poly-beta-1,6-N-acetylglucosamine synthase-like glycosyltransferase
MIVTGARDEDSNLPKLYKSLLAEIEKSELDIHWYVCVNDSTDNSLNLINEYQAKHHWIKNYSRDFGGEYALGIKTSTINRYLFDCAEQEYDFYCICDADIIPIDNMFSKLITNLKSNSEMGLISGVPSKLKIANSEVVYGNCRIWTRECFFKAPYAISLSADSISLQRAKMLNFLPQSFFDIKFVQRDYGERVNYGYYGHSAAYRGVSPFFALLKTSKLIFIGELSNGIRYFYCFFKNHFFIKHHYEDSKVRSYVNSQTGFLNVLKKIRKNLIASK